jgi:aryl-alcohol dehydrogenase-like predicted oxidoreductase
LPHHLPEAVDALGLELTAEEVQAIEAPYQQYGPSWY